MWLTRRLDRLGKVLFAFGFALMTLGVLFRPIIPHEAHQYLVVGGGASNSLGISCFGLASVIRLLKFKKVFR